MKLSLNKHLLYKLVNFTISALILFSGFAFSQTALIQVQADVDKSVITIGDRITYSLKITHQKQLFIQQPGPGANLGQFEIKNYKIHDISEQDNLITQKFDYEISVFDTGTFVIPPFPVAFTTADTSKDYQIIMSEALEIRVNSVLTGEENDIRDVKAPEEIPFDYFKLSLYILAGLLVVTAILLAIYIIRTRKKGAPLFRREVVRPAHEIAFEALAALEHSWKEMLEAGEHKQLFTKISEIFRQYLENRFFIKAMEETSFEIMESLVELNLIDDDYQRGRLILDLSDRVKFAKWVAQSGETENCLSELHQFIENTKLEFEAVENRIEIDETVEDALPSRKETK